MEILFIGLFVGLVSYFSYRSGVQATMRKMQESIGTLAVESYDLGFELGRIEEAVAAGTITEEEADRRIANLTGAE